VGINAKNQLKNMSRFKLFITVLLPILIALSACQETTRQLEKLVRPFIWVKASEKEGILKRIENNLWAKELFGTLQKRADKTTSF